MIKVLSGPIFRAAEKHLIIYSHVKNYAIIFFPETLNKKIVYINAMRFILAHYFYNLDLQHRNHLDLSPQVAFHDQDALVTVNSFPRAGGLPVSRILLARQVKPGMPAGPTDQNHVPWV